nr:unnamed protein product [Callosobruchus analis]
MDAPSVADPRTDTTLDCQFDMGGEELYAVKWYKDDQEFFRICPWPQSRHDDVSSGRSASGADFDRLRARSLSCHAASAVSRTRRRRVPVRGVQRSPGVQARVANTEDCRCR